MVIACEEPDEPGVIIGGGAADANAPAVTSDAASPMMAEDAAVGTPGSAGGGNAGGGNAGGGNAGGGNTGGGSTGDANAPGSTGGLDAAATPGDADAGSNEVIIGPSVRRDGGPPKWDPDAAGPILNPAMQTACMALAQNICTRITECQVEVGGLPESRRTQIFEACQNSFLSAHNCHRAVGTASGFAACSEATKTADCNAVFATEFGSSCVDQITLQP